ncbi:MAG: hypothetical protein KBS53_06145, partial [Bacteroidales bacterium]|nr:hypothetical protein [Candidatus Hennigimonas equi]
GGAWGMALLAAYMVKGNGLSLADYLDEKVFKGNAGVEINLQRRMLHALTDIWNPINHPLEFSVT